MKKAIISGANGFIGRAVTKELVNNGYRVLCLVRNTSNFCFEDNSQISIEEFDLESPFSNKDRIREFQGDFFFHFAWNGSAGEIRKDYDAQIENVRATIQCMKLAKYAGCSRFVYAASISEFESILSTMNNDSTPSLSEIYGQGKYLAHATCKTLSESIGIDFVSGMITNAYGVGENSPRLINTTLKKCINNEPPKFTSGVQNYDFVYIEDVARAFRLVGERGKNRHNYVIGSSQAKPLKSFLEELQAVVAPELEFCFGDVPFSGINLPIECFNCERTELDTGFRAEIDFKEGCTKTYYWLKNAKGEEDYATEF